MDLTKEILVAVAADFNKVIQLDPAIGSRYTEIDFTNEEDYIEALLKEIKDVCEFKNAEGKYELLQSGDIPLFQKETVEAIRVIAPDTAKRLKEVFGAVEEKKEIVQQEPKVVEKKPVQKEKTPKREYTRSHALVEAIQMGGGTQKEMIEIADKLYQEHTGTSNLNVAKSLLHYVLPSLILLNIVKEEPKGIYKPIK